MDSEKTVTLYSGRPIRRGVTIFAIYSDKNGGFILKPRIGATGSQAMTTLLRPEQIRTSSAGWTT